MRRHLESPQLQQAQAPGRAIRRIQLVDAEFGAMGVAGHINQQVAQQSVHLPRCAGLTRLGHLREGNFQFVQRVVARLIHPWRLRRRTDEQARKQIGQRRMVVPITDQAAQQVWPTQKR
ncbi:hypothetical protein D3C76_1467270 [compost metagenome]